MFEVEKSQEPLTAQITTKGDMTLEYVVHPELGPVILADSMAEFVEYRDAEHMTRNLPDDEKGRYTVLGMGGEVRKRTFITTRGMNRVIMTRKLGFIKDDARRAVVASRQNWILDVLDEIRMMGQYKSPGLIEQEFIAEESGYVGKHRTPIYDAVVADLKAINSVSFGAQEAWEKIREANDEYAHGKKKTNMMNDLVAWGWVRKLGHYYRVTELGSMMGVIDHDYFFGPQMKNKGKTVHFTEVAIGNIVDSL